MEMELQNMIGNVLELFDRCKLKAIFRQYDESPTWECSEAPLRQDDNMTKFCPLAQQFAPRDLSRVVITSLIMWCELDKDALLQFLEKIHAYIAADGNHSLFEFLWYDIRELFQSENEEKILFFLMEFHFLLYVCSYNEPMTSPSDSCEYDCPTVGKCRKISTFTYRNIRGRITHLEILGMLIGLLRDFPTSPDFLSYVLK